MIKPIKLLLISDGKTGHDNASHGIINCIKNIYEDVLIDTIEVKIKSKFILKILKYLFQIEFIKNYLLNKSDVIDKFYLKKSDKTLNFDYDYIISAGGDTSFINIYYSNKYKIKNIYASRLRGIDNNLFYMLPTIYEEENFENSILVDFSPIEKKVFDNQKVERFKKEIKIENEKIFTLLIGGNGSGYIYTKRDFKNLVENFLVLLEKNNAYGIISTSRRTSLENELYIENLLSVNPRKNRLKYIILFNKKQEYLLDCYFSISSIVFLTEESGAMLTESILSNKPVFTLKPNKIKYNKLYNKFLVGKEKYISKSLKIEELNSLKLNCLKINNLISPSKFFELKFKEFLEKNK